MTEKVARRPAPPEVEVTRRRFARRQWARRWLEWRVLVAGLLALVLVAGGVWTVWFSDVLDVEGVDVRGNQLLADDQVLAVADVPTGEPLVRADLDAVRRRIEALPAVDSATVSRKWPHEVLVEITERQPVAAVQVGSRLRGIDADGVLFRDFRARPPGLPLIKADPGAGREALAEGAAVLGSLRTKLLRRVDFIELRTVDQITLRLRDGRRVVWGSAEQSADKARVLAALLRIEAREYDVSVPGQPTTRG